MSIEDYVLTQEIVDDMFASRLKFNTATKDVYLDGELFNIAKFRKVVFDEFRTFLTNDKYIYERTYLRAKEHPFSPIEDYLNESIAKYPEVDYNEVFRKLNEEVLHIQSDSVMAKYLPRTLVGAVKRIYEPASQHDSVLILKGAQGFYKTSFFKKLAGDEHFTSTTFRKFGKDELMLINSKWIIELDRNRRYNSVFYAFTAQRIHHQNIGFF